jgi:hypothetical protein
MISPELPAPRDMLACKVLMQMVDEAGEEFARAEAAVDQAFPLRGRDNEVKVNSSST